MSITTYEDLTLLDPRPAPLDDELRRLCAAFRARPAGIRNSLTADDLYTLLLFARRAAVFAMRGRDTAWIADGLTAVALIDDERIDDRGEIARTLGLLHHAVTLIGADADALFAAAAKQATRSVARGFRQPRFSGYDATAAGFVRRNANEYRPSHDLLRTALEIRAMLERDRYRVDDVVLATALPEVWFDAPPRPAGVVTIGARHRDDAEQVALAFVAELDEPPHVAAAGDVASVAVVEGNLLCVLVASHETAASLQRFAGPVRQALAR